MDGAGKILYFSNMHPQSRPEHERAIQTWSLYGETSDSVLADWLHAEPIQERSRLHGYFIKPHRHALLFQVLHLTAGEAILHLDGGMLPLAPATAVTMPPLVAHGFDFTPDVAGTVVSLFHRDLLALFGTAPDLLAHFERPRVVSLAGHGREAAMFDSGIAGIVRESTGSAIGRDQVLSASLSLMLTALRRAEAVTEHEGGAPEPGDRRAVALVQAYQQLIDQHFASHAPVAHYARLLGITAAHLNRVCRAVAGTSALQLINRRLVLEAKRHLAFTSHGIKQVSAVLGFEDPAYFARFFLREAGLSPSAFRAGLLAETQQR